MTPRSTAAQSRVPPCFRSSPASKKKGLLMKVAVTAKGASATNYNYEEDVRGGRCRSDPWSSRVTDPRWTLGSPHTASILSRRYRLSGPLDDELRR